MKHIPLNNADAIALKQGCDSEPVHIPGMIQPHGVLFVLDQDREEVLQVAGDPESLIGFLGQVRGKALNEVLGISLADLMATSRVTLAREPVYVGTVDGSRSAGLLTVTAHLVNGSVVVELENAAEPRSALSLLASIRLITETIGDASSLLEAANIAAHEVRTITDYDHVMVYQFLGDGSGSVVAEAKVEVLSSFLHHRFPASDIPSQARELYRKSLIRVIPDVGYVPSSLIPSTLPGTGDLLDMSHCALRSVSPVHIKYLKNMGVGASMSVSLLLHGELWGLIACHNRTPMGVPYEARELCKHVAQIFAQKTAALSDLDEHRLSHELGSAATNLIRDILNTADPSSALLDRCSALQEIVRSDGLAISWKGCVTTAGRVPTEVEIGALADWLRARLVGGETFATVQLSEQYSEAAQFQSDGSGLLSVLVEGDDPPLLIWFRAEQVQEVYWAGNPHEPLDTSSRLGALNPRKSFATWLETVRGRSRPWREVEIGTVRDIGRRLAIVLQQQRVVELNLLLRQANDQLASLAATDGLTGLANRRAFDERLDYEWLRARRRSAPMSLIILDLDFFKQYNDHFGHPEGDACLRQISQIIVKYRRSTDLPARIGGEEFSILLPETDLQGALVIAERIRAEIEAFQLSHPKSALGVVTASCGVAHQIPTAKSTAQDLVRAADEALYAAKAAGRNRVWNA